MLLSFSFLCFTLQLNPDAHMLFLAVLWFVATVLKNSLRGLFKSYGEVLDVVAHNNLRMRGQAFVSFESPEIAAKALKEVKGFPLYSKPMVRLRSYPKPIVRLTYSFMVIYILAANFICTDSVRCSGEEVGREQL